MTVPRVSPAYESLSLLMNFLEEHPEWTERIFCEGEPEGWEAQWLDSARAATGRGPWRWGQADMMAFMRAEACARALNDSEEGRAWAAEALDFERRKGVQD